MLCLYHIETGRSCQQGTEQVRETLECLAGRTGDSQVNVGVCWQLESQRTSVVFPDLACYLKGWTLSKLPGETRFPAAMCE